MNLNAPQEYCLTPLGKGRYALVEKARTVRFSKPASSSDAGKVYTLSRQGRLLYVGVAMQRMSARLWNGFAASGKGGYHGYKWKDLRSKLRLVVWTASTSGKPARRRDLETVEAEVAFLCRQRSGQWPRYQNEIHFYSSRADHRAAAERIYSYATGTGSARAGHGSQRT